MDRLKVANRLSAQRDPMLPPLNVCIQTGVELGAAETAYFERAQPGFS